MLRSNLVISKAVHGGNSYCQRLDACQHWAFAQANGDPDMTALSGLRGSQAGSDDRRRMPWLVTILLAAVTLLLSMLPGSAQAATPADDSAKPTIVLVHGAFASPSGWDRVVEDLEKDGYETVAPALALTSITGDTAIVRAALDATPGDKIW